MSKQMTGAQRIVAERQRQLAEEGYTLEHDAEHNNAALAWAAAVYAAPERFYRIAHLRDGITWHEPWPAHWRRGRGSWAGDRKVHSTKERVRELEKAGALIAAEIDRLLATSSEDA